MNHINAPRVIADQQAASGVIYGAALGAETQAMPSQLSRTMARLAECIGELSNELASLEYRLVNVLDPVGKGLNEEAPVPRPVRCPLGDEIDNSADAVYAITQRVRVLLGRMAV